MCETKKKFIVQDLSLSDQILLSVLLQSGLNTKKFQYVNYRIIAEKSNLTYDAVKYRMKCFEKADIITRSIYQNTKTRRAVTIKLNQFLIFPENFDLQKAKEIYASNPVKERKEDNWCLHSKNRDRNSVSPKEFKKIYITKKVVIYSDKRQDKLNSESELKIKIREEAEKHLGVKVDKSQLINNQVYSPPEKDIIQSEDDREYSFISMDFVVEMPKKLKTVITNASNTALSKLKSGVINPIKRFLKSSEVAAREKMIRLARSIWKTKGRVVGCIKKLRTQLTYLILKMNFTIDQLKELLDFVLDKSYWSDKLPLSYFVSEFFIAKKEQGKYKIDYKTENAKKPKMFKDNNLKNLINDLMPLLSNIRANYKQCEEVLDQYGLYDFVIRKHKSVEAFRFMNKYQVIDSLAQLYCLKYGKEMEETIGKTPYQLNLEKIEYITKRTFELIPQFKTKHEELSHLYAREGILHHILEEIRNLGNIKSMPAEKIKRLIKDVVMPSSNDESKFAYDSYNYDDD